MLEVSHPKAKSMDFYLLLARQPQVLLERSQAFNAIMYAPGGLSRAERVARGLQRLDRVPVEDARTLAFDVDFEFISTPSTGEGVITDLVLDIEPDG